MPRERDKLAAVLKLLTVPATNDRGPRFMEKALAAIHQADRARRPVSLHYAPVEGRVALCVDFPDELEEMVCGPLTANYPSASLTTIPRFDPPPDGWGTWAAAVMLSPELFPILRHAQFEDIGRTFADPIDSILRSVRPSHDTQCRVELRIAPAGERRCRTARRTLRVLDREFFHRHYALAEYYATRRTGRFGSIRAGPLGLLARQTAVPSRSVIETSASRMHDREEHLQAAADKLGGHLFETRLMLIVHAPPESESAALRALQQMFGALGAFTKSHLATFRLEPLRASILGLSLRRSTFLASHEELATLFHPPTASVAAEGLLTSDFAELEPPAKFHSGMDRGAVTIGRVRFRGDQRPIGIAAEDRLRHTYIVGSTGTGKSTLLLNLIRQDMQAGRGLSLIDVHGDLAEAAERLIPADRRRDVVLFDAASDRALPFNPLACSDPARLDQVASGVVSAFRKLYDSWGPRLENLLRYAAFTIVERQGTLLDVLRLLTDKAYRDQTVLHVQDDVVRAFWQNEFASWNTQYRTEAVSSVTNKIMPFVTNRRLRAITCSPARRSLDLRQLMDEEKILIANISRGKLGQDNATLLGSLMLTAVEQAALTRADVPEHRRRDHVLYLDEFQSLVTPSTSIMLSESRKYRLGLVLSHQLTRQLDPATYHAVIGNCGTLVAFRVGLEDAELLAPAFSKHESQLKPADLANLPNYHAYARLLIDGVPSSPASIATLPPVAPEHPTAAASPRHPGSGSSRSEQCFQSPGHGPLPERSRR